MNRQELLEKLLNFDGSLDVIISGLAKFGWDSDEELVTLKPEHVLSVLERYIDSQLSAQDVEDWANVLENREDIFQEEVAEEIVNELANPLLTRELTVETARELMAKIYERQ